jgi:hypothetical protein
MAVIILAIWGERIKLIFIRPKLSFLEVKATRQRIGNQDVVMYRLVLKNSGKAMARDVRATVSQNRNIDQNRFIPFPLNWTHIDGRKRSIACEEEAYLDLFQQNGANYIWYWPGGRIPDEYALSNLNTVGKSKIQITFHEESSFLGFVELEFDPTTGICNIL